MSHSTDPEEAMGQNTGPTLEDICGFDSDSDFRNCPTCKGSGTVNALTNPDGAPFVASYGYCPACDGTGEAP